MIPQSVNGPKKVTPESPLQYQDEQDLNETIKDSSFQEQAPPSPKELPIADDLLTAPSEKLPGSTSSSRRVPLSTAAVHEELSAQLAQMASQLKRNAIHFSDTLIKDQAVVEETKSKMESNLDELHKEQTGLGDYSREGRGATIS